MKMGACLAAGILLVMPCCNVIGGGQTWFVAWYENGNLWKEGHLLHDTQVGPWSYYYDGAGKRAHGEYKNDLQIGSWTYYHRTGQLRCQGQFDQHGRRTGVWTFYFEDGSRRAEGRYSDDAEQGIWTFWNRAGRRIHRGGYLDGRQVGLWQHWRDDGSPLAEGLMLDDARVGPWRIWNDAGEVAIARLAPPKDCTLVVEYDPEGEVRRTGLSRDDRQIGGWVTRHPNGELRLMATFDDGAARGGWRAFRGSGRDLAEGLIAAGGLDPWRTLRLHESVPQESHQLPKTDPATPVEWSAPELAVQRPPVRVVEQWFAEIRSPAGDNATQLAPDAPAATAEQIDALPADPRLPAIPQPAWTLREQEELPGLVSAFTTGRASGSESDPATPRRRTDLEGRALRLDQMSSPNRAESPIALVLLEGFDGRVNVRDVAQLRSLAVARDQLASAHLAVIVVCPGHDGDAQAVLERYRYTFGEPLPFSVTSDPHLELVNRLGAADHPARATTVLIDEQGIIQHAWTSDHRTDRPPVTELRDLARE